MKAGRLRERIGIVRRTTVTEQEFGSEKTVETTILTARAEIRHDRGTRLEENGEVVHTYDLTFITWLHVLDHVRETDEVAWRNRRYRIVSLEPVRDSMILYIKASLINE